MKKKRPSIISKLSGRLSSVVLLAALLVLWQAVCVVGLVPAFMLPSPLRVLTTLVEELPVLAGHAAISLSEAFAGLGLGVAAAFLFAVLMDHSKFLDQALYPLLMITQTVPTIAIAPLLVLWMGYGLTPKIALVFLVCFFPVTVGLRDGFRSADSDAIRLLQSMGASNIQIFTHIKLPYALPGFFTGFKTSVAYSIVGAVIAEWLGGEGGLGVYMTRVRKGYAFDKMFAVIFLISVLSLSLMGLVAVLEKSCMPWKHTREREG